MDLAWMDSREEIAMVGKRIDEASSGTRIEEID